MEKENYVKKKKNLKHFIKNGLSIKNIDPQKALDLEKQIYYLV